MHILGTDHSPSLAILAMVHKKLKVPFEMERRWVVVQTNPDGYRPKGRKWCGQHVTINRLQ